MRTKIRESTQTLKDFARPYTIAEEHENEDIVLRDPIHRTSSITITTTGNIDDLDFGNADLIRMNNASLATIRGMKAGVDGQRLTIVSIGAGQVDLANQNAGSTAENRLINFATSGPTSLSAGFGVATYQYDAVTARWRIASHQQGQWIDIPFSASNFTASGAGTWTLTSPDQITFRYILSNTTIQVVFVFNTTSVSGTPSTLRVVGPSTFTAKAAKLNPNSRVINNAGTATVGLVEAIASNANISFYADLSGGSTLWADSTNNTYVQGSFEYEVN